MPHINRMTTSDGGRHNSVYHPKLMNWAIAFLARTSSGTYNKVAKIFMMTHIITVYQKTAEIITTKNNKAYCLHMHTIRNIGERAHFENWTSHQRIGAIAQDSANINSGIEHYYVTNNLSGGNEQRVTLHCNSLMDVYCNGTESEGRTVL